MGSRICCLLLVNSKGSSEPGNLDQVETLVNSVGAVRLIAQDKPAEMMSDWCMF